MTFASLYQVLRATKARDNPRFTLRYDDDVQDHDQGDQFKTMLIIISAPLNRRGIPR